LVTTINNQIFFVSLKNILRVARKFFVVQSKLAIDLTIDKNMVVAQFFLGNARQIRLPNFGHQPRLLKTFNHLLWQLKMATKFFWFAPIFLVI